MVVYGTEAIMPHAAYHTPLAICRMPLAVGSQTNTIIFYANVYEYKYITQSTHTYAHANTHIYICVFVYKTMSRK